MEILNTSFTGETNYGNETYRLALMGSVTDESVVIELTIETDGGTCGSLKITKTESGLSLTKWDAGTYKFVACVLANGGGVLAGELASCQVKHGFKPLQIIDCMMAKGHIIEPALASALISCWIDN